MNVWKLGAKGLAPENFYKWSKFCLYGLALVAVVAISYGAFSGLFVAPNDYQQKDAFRIIYVHVPCAFLSLSLYLFLVVSSICFLIWRIKIYDYLAMHLAPVGALFTFLALVTGAIWGKPMWGTWWVWDARLTSELILLFIYFGIIGVREALLNQKLASKLAAIVSIVGFVNVPIIHYSVQWWQTLHQGATLAKLGKAAMPAPMLYPLLGMLVGFYALAFCLVLIRARTQMLIVESNSQWVKKVLHAG